MTEQTWSLGDFFDVAGGAAVLGSGGGGGYQDALLILSQMEAWGGSVVVKDYDGQSPCSVMAMMGSPDAAGEMSLAELARALGNTLAAQRALTGFSPACAIPIEIGPINSLVPLLAAALELGDVRWVVDGDGAGRAVPELQQTTFAGAAQLAPSPCVVANTAVLPADVLSGVVQARETTQVETLAGSLVKAFGAFAGISMWPSMPANDFALRGHYIAGTLGQARALGHFLRQRPDTAALVREIAAITGRAAAAVACNYYITGVSQATSEASLDAGRLRLDNHPDPAQSTHYLTLYNLNENLIAYACNDAAPLILAPDSICYYSEDEAAGFSNATEDLAVYFDFTTQRSTGKKVSLIKVATAPQLAASPGVRESFASLLCSIGYAGPLPC
jgi:uncharacterized protein